MVLRGHKNCMARHECKTGQISRISGDFLVLFLPGSPHFMVWPEWILWWFLRTEACEVENPHSWQRNFLSVEWVTMCAVRACFHLKLTIDERERKFKSWLLKISGFSVFKCLAKSYV